METKKIFLFLLLICSQAFGYSQVTSFIIDEGQINNELSNSLDSIYNDDQSYRIMLFELMNNNASQKDIDSVRAIIKEKDRINLIKVEKIISQYGWLGPQEVGINGSQALFLVIQHSDLATQQKYLSIIREAEKEGKILSSNLAILEDRITMREGRKQLYGSQGFKDNETGIRYIYPIFDPDNLDKRRESMGMSPMKEYVNDWNLDEYKQKLPEIEAILKKTEQALIKKTSNY